MGRKRSRRKLPPTTPQATPPIASVQDESQPPFRNLIAAACLCVLTLLVYSNSTHGAFIVDSRIVILQDPRIRQATSDNVGQILNHSYWWPHSESGLYRPITTLSYLFNYSILGNGEQPEGYHWINLLLHMLNVLFLFGLALRIVRTFWASVFIAGAWATHPVLTESVTNVVGRADLLVGAAVLGGLLMYLKSTESDGLKRWGWLAGLMAITAIGVFSKENGVVIAAVIVVYELTWWKGFKQIQGLLYGGLALALPFLAMWYQRSVVLGASDPSLVLFVDNPLTGASFFTARLTAIKVLAKYLWILLWPTNLSWDYSYNQVPLVHGSPQDWIALLAIAACVIATAFLFRKNKVCFFFAAFAIVTIAPVSNLVILIGTIMAERLVYLSSIGFIVCMVLALRAIGDRLQSRALASIALCLLIAGYGARTWVRNNDWHDNAAMVASGVHAAPDSFKTHDALASSMFESDRTFSNIDAVIQEEGRSIAILNSLPDSQNSAEPFTNAGLYFERRGAHLAAQTAQGDEHANPEVMESFKESLRLLTRARSIDKLLEERLVRAQMARGKLESEIAPSGLPQLYQELTLTYMRLGDLRNAYDSVILARLFAPNKPEVYGLLSTLLEAANRKDEAAMVLIEGILTSGDKGLISPLRKLYSEGLDPTGCAIVETANGPDINNSCQVVHAEICNASGDLMSVYRKIQKPDLVEETRKRAIQVYGCPASGRN